MRCECCDRILSDSEATSKFKDSGAYTNMCTTCQGYLPKELKIVTRKEEPETDVNVETYEYWEGIDDEIDEEE